VSCRGFIFAGGCHAAEAGAGDGKRREMTERRFDAVVDSGNVPDTSLEKEQNVMKDHLVGMLLVVESTGHEHYRTGHIAAAVGDCYLVQFDKIQESEAPPLPPMELYTLEELSRTCVDCGQKLVSLFKTRADMTEWIAWLNQPEKPAGQPGKVVHLKKPH